MTNPYTDLKEAAEKVIADQLAYISGKKLKDEMAWHDALSKYRQLADPRSVLSLLADYERMREALEEIAKPMIIRMPNERGGQSADVIAAKRLAEACKHLHELARAAIKEKSHD